MQKTVSLWVVRFPIALYATIGNRETKPCKRIAPQFFKKLYEDCKQHNSTFALRNCHCAECGTIQIRSIIFCTQSNPKLRSTFPKTMYRTMLQIWNCFTKNINNQDIDTNMNFDTKDDRNFNISFLVNVYFNCCFGNIA